MFSGSDRSLGRFTSRVIRRTRYLQDFACRADDVVPEMRDEEDPGP